MLLEEQISKDYIAAMKAKDSKKSSALSFLRAQIKNVKIDKRVETVEDAEVVGIIKKQVKQRHDSIKQFTEGGRPELAQKEQDEIDVLSVYLPEEMSEDKIQEVVEAVIAETGASSIKDMGNVMKEVMAKTAGQADNGLVSQVVKSKLMAS